MYVLVVVVRVVEVNVTVVRIVIYVLVLSDAVIVIENVAIVGAKVLIDISVPVSVELRGICQTGRWLREPEQREVCVVDCGEDLVRGCGAEYFIFTSTSTSIT